MQRYDCLNGLDGGMFAHADGEWVRYEDDGLLSLHFRTEDEAVAFMERLQPTVEIDEKLELQLATTPLQAESSFGMSKSWQTAVAVAREAPSGRTVVDSAVILAIDKRLSEAFAEMQEANAMCASLSTTVKDLTNAVAATIAAHLAELQEVRKDAVRLDWLLEMLSVRALDEIGVFKSTRDGIDAVRLAAAPEATNGRPE